MRPKLTLEILDRETGAFVAILRGETEDGIVGFRGYGPSLAEAVHVALMNIRDAAKTKRGRPSKRHKVAGELIARHSK